MTQPIKGYREISPDERDAVNEIKKMEEGILLVIDLLELTPPDGAAIQPDRRWLAIARTDLEKGFMALNRSILRPQRINLKEAQ